MRSLTIATISRQANHAIRAVVSELGASCLHQQHLGGHAKHSQDRTNSLFRPFAPAAELLIANQTEASALALAAPRTEG